MTHALETRAVNPDKPYGNVDYADPGFQSDGKARYPLDSEAHCRAAWSYVNQADNADQYTPAQLARVKARILTAGKRYGITFAEEHDAPGRPEEPNPTMRSVGEFCTRGFDFELRSRGNNDGRTLEGYVAVFNKRTRIPDRNGDFEEEILPGFAERSLREHGYPTLQFDHGKDARVGSTPIGVYTSFEQDRKGYHVRGELFDNPIVEPIRQAIAGGAIKGMSFRFHVSKNGGDRWERRAGSMDLRTVLDADVPEAGPVVFPAYRDTSVTVRSILAAFDEDEREEMIRELREQAGLATDLTDLTGQSDAWSDDGGDPDAESWEDDASPEPPSPEQQARDRAMRLLRPPIVLP